MLKAVMSVVVRRTIRFRALYLSGIAINRFPFQPVKRSASAMLILAARYAGQIEERKAKMMASAMQNRKVSGLILMSAQTIDPIFVRPSTS
jgi:hypothetical protein